jgi:hypothetical protein
MASRPADSTTTSVELSPYRVLGAADEVAVGAVAQPTAAHQVRRGPRSNARRAEVWHEYYGASPRPWWAAVRATLAASALREWIPSFS